MTIKTWLKRRKHQSVTAIRANTGRERRRTKLQLQCLEPRHLLAASAWTNPINPLDATGDSQVTIRDALVIVNELARAQASDSTTLRPPPILGADDADTFHYDTTGEGEVSIRDALKVINAIARGQTGTVAPQGVSEQPDQLDSTAERLSTSENYARAEGELASTDDRDVFRFTATASRAAVNLSAINDESVTVVRILDANRNEITATSRRSGEDRFAGVDFATEPGQEYFLVVDSVPESEITDFYYAIEVFQYDTATWAPSSDSEVGNDLHGDTGADATLIESNDGFVRVSSFIDSSDDKDVFRIDVIDDRISVEAFGLDPPSFAASVTVEDSSGSSRSPITTTTGVMVIPAQSGETLYLTVTGLNNDTGQYILDVHQYAADVSVLSAQDSFAGGSGLRRLIIAPKIRWHCVANWPRHRSPHGRAAGFVTGALSCGD